VDKLRKDISAKERERNAVQERRNTANTLDELKEQKEE